MEYDDEGDTFFDEGDDTFFDEDGDEDDQDTYMSRHDTDMPDEQDTFADRERASGVQSGRVGHLSRSELANLTPLEIARSDILTAADDSNIEDPGFMRVFANTETIEPVIERITPEILNPHLVVAAQYCLYKGFSPSNHSPESVALFKRLVCSDDLLTVRYNVMYREGDKCEEGNGDGGAFALDLLRYCVYLQQAYAAPAPRPQTA